MRTPERTKPRRDGTVRYKVRYRIDGRETAKFFVKERDALTFAGMMGDGDRSQVADALAWLAHKEGGKSTGPTFGAWFEEYVTQLTGVNPRTRDDYRSMHRLHLAHLDRIPLEGITRSHVTGIVNSMEADGLSPKTIENVIYGLLAPCLALAVDEGKINRNPTKRVRLPEQRLDAEDEGEVNFLTHEEFAALHSATPPHYKPLVMWLVGTGMRWSEATALHKRHIDLTAGTSSVRQAWKKNKKGASPYWVLGPPKTKKGKRTVNVATAALVAVKPLLDDKKPTDYVFTTVTGQVVRHNNFYDRVWIPACIKAGLGSYVEGADGKKHWRGPSPHDCRDTHASWLISSGISLEAVQDQLGHSSILTTRDRYAHLLPAVGVEVGRAASAAMERALGTQPQQIEGPS